VRIRELRFEDWDGPAEAFDLVVCAQAWHWLDHARAADVAARALRPDGVLAVWWNRPRAVEGPVLEAVRRAYHRHAPGLLAETSLLDLKATPEVPEEVRGFRSWRTESFGWRRAYDASSYAALMSTQGDHRLLPGEQLARLIGAVQRAIEEHANRMAYEFTADLSVAKRLPV
jgi:SAM-dependent methyltransferase